MPLNYEDALKAWGKQRLETAGYANVDPESVTVAIASSPGFACCGGRDPDCYCSYAEAASCNVSIYGTGVIVGRGGVLGTRRVPGGITIDMMEADFTDIVREIIEAGNAQEADIAR